MSATGSGGLMATQPVKMHRIQRRHVIGRSPCEAEHMVTDRWSASFGGFGGLGGLGGSVTPFTVPLAHVWSLRVAGSEQPHIVLFHSKSDATVVTRAMATFKRENKRLPDHYNDMHALFTEHYCEAEKAVKSNKPLRGRRPNAQNAMSVEEVLFEDVVRWVAARRMGLLVISKIVRSDEGRKALEVPTSLFTPDYELSAVESEYAFREDFGWQLQTMFDELW